ncbi:MAG TPA: alpha-isopropylmalate synthase regulatory domain-containing protein [Bacteroidales bacterium]|jgi:D-citramalate synthase|nr:alpha-isopropylmalate synthase regulatory domain-containing protein [Bacteroidales bacterium]
MVEILDTTLRDGEQTSGVSFASQEKMSMVRLLLEELKVDRMEVASARVSSGEFDAVKRIATWAASHDKLDRIEVLGFLDKGVSLEWIHNTGCRVINLLCKGSLNHVTHQLRRSPQEHLADILDEIERAQSMGISVNVYLEDWSNGMISSPDYVFQLVEGLKDAPIKRFMLPDTLGILNPEQTRSFCSDMIARFPKLHFDFHAHNDYDLAVANVMAAVTSGVKGIHVTVNGLGERAGNAALTSVVAVLHDQLKIRTNIREEKLTTVSKIVESYSGIRIPANKPVIGDNVFTQCAGIHADGDAKNNLYYNDLLPERFGRVREYALGKTSGKASIRKNLEALGIELDDDAMRLVTERIIELGDKKEQVTQEDLPYIISDVLKQEDTNQPVRILNYSLSLAQGLKPVATLKLELNGLVYQETSPGDGQYDAFVKALRRIYKNLSRPFPMLMDYSVTIPPGGRTDAFVQTVITWSYNGKTFRTAGLDADQTEAAIKATLKMLNIIELK